MLIKKPMNTTCKQCHGQFEITENDLKFYDQISPVFGGKKFLIPPPTLCPTCRLQRRMAWRNDRTLHHRKSDLTGKQIISMYSAEKPYKVYDQDEWWSDNWDAITYGKDFDFTKTFSEQFDELAREVPHISLYTTNCENSYYTNHALNLKNCYLIAGGGNDEDCLYGRFVVNSKDTLEGGSLYSCENCYEGIASEKCYNCMFFTYTKNCSDCIMIEDCQGCRNCIGCFGLRNKEYCIFNKQYTKEEYFAWKEKFLPLTWKKIEELRKTFNELKLGLPHRDAHIYASEDCTGDMISGSKNCESCFDSSECENSKFLSFTPKGINSYDCTFNAPDGVEWCYEAGSTVGANMCFSTFLVWNGDNIYYSTECHHNSYLFGCVGLRNKKYCILNKQYTKEEYEELMPKIIEHMRKTTEWGEYLPLNISRFGYNESVAQDYFPLTKEEVLRHGWKWHEDQESQQNYMGPRIEPPEQITQTNDSILNEILVCSVTGKPYRITKQELKFYRQSGVPVPKKCPDQRHKERLGLRNPRQLWDRNCMNCTTPIQTTYSPERPEKVYCQKCYLEAVY